MPSSKASAMIGLCLALCVQVSDVSFLHFFLPFSNWRQRMDSSGSGEQKYLSFSMIHMAHIDYVTTGAVVYIYSRLADRQSKFPAADLYERGRRR